MEVSGAWYCPLSTNAHSIERIICMCGEYVERVLRLTFCSMHVGTYLTFYTFLSVHRERELDLDRVCREV